MGRSGPSDAVVCTKSVQVLGQQRHLVHNGQRGQGLGVRESKKYAVGLEGRDEACRVCRRRPVLWLHPEGFH